MTKEFLFEQMRPHRYGVLSSLSPGKSPESALVGIAISEELEIIFDTVCTSRKYRNLMKNPSVAFVIGWENEMTIQYEGIARIPSKDELDRFLNIYFNVFPDGIDRNKTWKDIVYFIVHPAWIRYSNYNEPQRIEELSFV